MASELERFDFTPEFAVVIGPEFPGDGEWHCPVYGFGQGGALVDPFDSRWNAPLVARIGADRTWVASFDGGGGGHFTGVFACPSPSDLCVVANGTAFLVDVRHPEQGAEIVHPQVQSVIPVPGTRVLIFVGFADIAAIDPDGVAWRSDRLCLDDLQVTAASPAGIVCAGYHPLGQEPIVVDPSTGHRVTPGPT